ncbi:MAG: SCO family protein [Thiomonas arsenitoxydans]|uniref:SCO family protein n=1 Tax=Thiomonas arsenitoxydans (strain DSM 22701 / CIP 110005 / 3As) TaxID=426114 RepID=A0A8I1SUW4_THIA3|nr:MULTISPECIES: SCO family protein [Thiomonas]MBN8745040.1 SCO family protein [Thiomonas arsenitoxydans]ODU95696.1 MAG: photosynthetic protein synthase I [Thiomonas sp. SCN 64-16]
MPARFSAARRSLVLSAAFAPLASLVLTACSKPYVFHGVDITGVPYADGFSLTDFNGKTRTLADFAGKVVVMYFGYTQCPDICPASMQVVAQAMDDLGEKARDVQFLFVTVDPERDTPEILKAYVTHFNPTFLALTGTPEQIALTAKDFKVYYKKVPGKTPGSYTMDHTAGFYVFDPKGKIRLFEREGVSAKDLAQDINALIEGH